MRDFTRSYYTFGFYYFILSVSFGSGRADMAYVMIRAYDGARLSLGFTSFAEHFDLREALAPTALAREINVHLDGSSAQPCFLTRILGVQPLEKGFQEARIGDLAWAEGALHTPLGLLEVTWRVEEGVFSIDVRHPIFMRCEVVIPDGYARGQACCEGRMPT